MEGLFGATRPEPSRPLNEPVEYVRMGDTSFDAHLRRAGSDAARTADTEQNVGQENSTADNEPAAQTAPSDDAEAPPTASTGDEQDGDEQDASDAAVESEVDDPLAADCTCRAIDLTEVEETTLAEVWPSDAVTVPLMASDESASADLPADVTAVFSVEEVETTPMPTDASMETSITQPPVVETTESDATDPPPAVTPVVSMVEPPAEPATLTNIGEDNSQIAAVQTVQTVDDPEHHEKSPVDQVIAGQDLASEPPAGMDETTQKKAMGPKADAAALVDTIDSEPADPAPSPTARDAAPSDATTTGRAGSDPMTSEPTIQATAKPGEDRINAADRTRFIERVAGAFRAADRGDGSVRMKLHPPELGSLHLEVTTRNGGLVARLETDTPEARSLLLDNLSTLRDRLTLQEIKIERFEVIYQDGSGGRSPTGADDQQRSNDQSGGRPGAGSGQQDVEIEPHTLSSRAIHRHGGSQLDVII